MERMNEITFLLRFIGYHNNTSAGRCIVECCQQWKHLHEVFLRQKDAFVLVSQANWSKVYTVHPLTVNVVYIDWCTWNFGTQGVYLLYNQIILFVQLQDHSFHFHLKQLIVEEIKYIDSQYYIKSFVYVFVWYTDGMSFIQIRHFSQSSTLVWSNLIQLYTLGAVNNKQSCPPSSQEIITWAWSWHSHGLLKIVWDEGLIL